MYLVLPPFHILNPQSSFKDVNMFLFQGRVTVKPEGALIISPIKSEDAGTYICEVTNGIGRPQRAPAILEVTCEISVQCILNTKYCIVFLVFEISSHHIL